MILSRIVDKIKQNKDALETLGLPTGEDGVGDTDIDKMDFTHPDETTGRHMVNRIYNNNKQTNYNNQQYQSVGVLRTPNTRDETAKKKHQKKIVMDQDSSEIDERYHQL